MRGESRKIVEPGEGAGLPVAIVGIGCRFPGGIVDAKSYWDALVGERDAITEIPPDRIDVGYFYDPEPAKPGRMMTSRGGFLGELDSFDADFFGIAPREAERLDPQQRLLMETAWEALEDAGVDILALEGTRAGVYIGQWTSDFESRLFADPEAVDFYMTTGSGRYAVSGRLSYQLGLRGPSMTIDTACSSSLVAVHTAVRSLRDGESKLALAGGVNIILQPQTTIAYSQSRMMAPDGYCKFGDAKGDGYVRSEGVGIVVLKLLDRALEDGDRIYSIIRGSAVNNDGRSSGMMGRPSQVGQEELLRAAYEDAGIPPGEVDYVEAHGTGTRAGDPVELSALAAVLGEQRPPDRPAWVGSVKSNFGHTEGAAGIAGLIKASLSLRYGVIPASLHCHELTPAMDWSNAPLRIATKQLEWPAGGVRRVAGVSGYGISGTNGHVVLERAPYDEIDQSTIAEAPTSDEFGFALNLSARSAGALRSLARRYAELLGPSGAGEETASLHSLCAAAATRRASLSHRAVFMGSDSDSINDQLQAYASGGAATFEGQSQEPPRVVFVVPGQGAQWTGMARELLDQQPRFAESLRRCDKAATEFIDWSIVEQVGLEPGDSGYRLDQIDAIQPVLVAIAIAFSDWLDDLGIRPYAVIGHSMGEVGAAYIAGVLDLEQAMRVVCRRSALMKTASGRGAMAVVELSMQEAVKSLAGRESRLSVAVNNSPRSCVLSGDLDELDAVLREHERNSVFCRRIKVDVASHGPQMDEPAALLHQELSELVPDRARMPIVSTVLGRSADGTEFDGSYWARNLREPVRFADGINALLDEGASVFVELGPHPILVQAINENAQARGLPITTVACGRRNQPEQHSLLALLAELWCAGLPVAWCEWFGRTGHVQLPLYPWQRQHYWTPHADVCSGGPTVGRPRQLSSEQAGWLYSLCWQPVTLTEPANLTERSDGLWIVSGRADDDELSVAIASSLRAGGARAECSAADALAEVLSRHRDENPAGIALVLPGLSEAAYAPIAALQAIARASAGQLHAPKLWIVTRGGQAIDDDPHPVDLDQAAAWGAGRVIAEEQPRLWGGQVDVDPQAAPEDCGEQFVAAMSIAHAEDQLACRERSWFALRLQRDDGAGSRAKRLAWRKDGAYLITGGLGGLGLSVAAEMVRQGARRLVLMGRQGLPPRQEWSDANPESPQGRRILAVRKLESAGATVHVLNADVSRADDLERALSRYAAESWPPIIGVVHAAGILANRLALELDPETFGRVLEPKLAGARNLDRLLPDVELFVLFSSIIAVLGFAGMANYAAANASLDALAANRRQRGAHGLSIQWGAWQDTGMLSRELTQNGSEDMLRRGIGTITPEQGADLFGALLGSDAATLSIIPIDWAQYGAAYRGRVRPSFRKCIGDGGSSGSEDVSGGLAAAANPEQRQRLLENILRETLSHVLRIPSDRIDRRQNFGTLGLDSLMALELRNQLEGMLGLSLSATVTFNFPTVQRLARFLAGQFNVGEDDQKISDEEATCSNAGATETLVETTSGKSIEQMSDADIAAQLRDLRREGK
jgi:phthiocerol/phenolphthiocerol synthesis type-I polyketide synthase B